jgi:ketosteroid isomerase-like protein
MGATEDLALVQSGYEAFGRGDIPGVLAVLSPEIQWHIPGRNPMAGTYKGHEEVVGFFTQLMERTGGTFNLEIHDFLASDDHVVALTRETGQRDGKSLDSNVVHIWHLRDGKAVEFFGITQDQHAGDDFWA